MDNITQLDQAITTLLRILLVQERRLSNETAAVSFNPLDLETLSYLDRYPGAVAKDIAIYLQVSATTMQSVVDRLEKRGLIAKDKSALKGRAIARSLTLAGRNFRDVINAQNIQNCKTMLAAIDPLDQARFVHSMVKIAAEIARTA